MYIHYIVFIINIQFDMWKNKNYITVQQRFGDVEPVIF